MSVIRVIDRCPYPGGRFKADGPYSGEFFREEVLRPALTDAIERRQQLTVVLDGAPGYGSSFLEEAFGGLIRTRAFSAQDVRSWLKVAAENALYAPYESLADRYIQDAATHSRVAA
jgi:hypothetical protein